MIITNSKIEINITPKEYKRFLFMFQDNQFFYDVLSENIIYVVDEFILFLDKNFVGKGKKFYEDNEKIAAGAIVAAEDCEIREKIIDILIYNLHDSL